ncbi:hypothetical protein JQ604_10815 [Bradyrhizobium jicamae]|uniref:hypothetical protein n=1 Tax=Bradyrhizobium jicamae TaxID=280332 RepID=UPI001BA85BF6|nr:hypothetical protein [Bradyrhizobium jicamae]MBR0752676.1 hypothetical protein [Bradyrhizobium jicamae]
MRTYRKHLHRLNRTLAEQYICEHSHYLSTALEELAKAVPVALAIAQLHDSIRRSPARKFWPVIRETKGTLFIRSTDIGRECPRPWRRTKSGNMRYELPGYLLFSPWPPNFRRRVSGGMRWLQQLTDQTQILTCVNDGRYTILASAIWHATLGSKQFVPMIKAFQGLVMADSVAALDRWSDEQQRGSKIAVRISPGTLVYSDGQDRCEIVVPDALSAPLSVPSVPKPFEQLWVQAGDRAYL